VNSALNLHPKCGAWQAIFTIEVGSIDKNFPKRIRKATFCQQFSLNQARTALLAI